VNARVPVAVVVATLAAGCAGTGPARPGAGIAGSRPFAWGYTCADGYRFTARVRDDEARLDLGTREASLPHVRSASGTRYADGGTTYSSKGREASLRTPGATHDACHGRPAADAWDAAALRGATFRALGREPGWVLEIIPDRWIRLVYDYGTKRVLTPVPTPRLVGDEAAVYRAHSDAHTVELRILGEPCRDAMNGQRFPERVTVVLDGTELHGCGRRLHPR